MKFRLMAVMMAGALLATGCKSVSPQTQRLIETDAVAGGVVVGLIKYPQARPYIAASATVVCAASAGTNVSAAQIAADLQNSPQASVLKTPEGLLIINGALAVYSALEDQFGTNSAAMQNYAGGLCDGLNLGLAASPGLSFKAGHSPFHVPPYVQ